MALLAIQGVMRIFNKFRGTKGFIAAWEYMLRLRDMITEQAKRRVRILAFWEKHKAEATREAFKVSGRTLFRWQAKLAASGGKPEGLNPGSTAPQRRRTREASSAVIERILALRPAHPRFGKDKIVPLLAQEGRRISPSAVGRILAHLKKKGWLSLKRALSLQGKTGRLMERKPQKCRRKLRRPQGYRVLQTDTVVRFIDGVKRYIVTGIDTASRVAFAAGYANHGSRSAADFLMRARTVIPDCPDAVETDNGSEFALHFATACATVGITHFHAYPRSPKMNARVERFSRTLDEEFLGSYRALLRDDPAAFNDRLVNWLLRGAAASCAWTGGALARYDACITNAGVPNVADALKTIDSVLKVC